MDLMDFLKLVGVLLLVAANAFFVGSEIALTSARRSRIKQLADIGNRNAETVQILHNEPERFYSVTQVGITIVSLALGAVGIVTVTDVAEPVIDFVVVHLQILVPPAEAHAVAHSTASVFAFILISFMHIVGGELAPKVYAFHNAETLSLGVSRTINVLYKLFYGVIWFLNRSSTLLLRLFGQRDLTGPGGGHFSISEDELRTILMASEREGVLNPEATRMIRGVFDLEGQQTGDVMVPRVDVVGIACTSTVADALDVLRDEKHTRYPVYDGTIDKIVGMLLIKDLLHDIDSPEVRQTPISEIMRPALVVPDAQPLDVLLAQFKENRQQMAVVIDEYGGTAGVVTLEDIVEEIVGELHDEYASAQMFVHEPSGNTLINAKVEIDELTAELDFPFPEGDYNTLAGLMYTYLERVPQVSDSVDLPGCRLTVTAMEENRIAEVGFTRVRTEPAGETAAPELEPATTPRVRDVEPST